MSGMFWIPLDLRYSNVGLVILPVKEKVDSKKDLRKLATLLHP